MAFGPGAIRVAFLMFESKESAVPVVPTIVIITGSPSIICLGKIEIESVEVVVAVITDVVANETAFVAFTVLIVFVGYHEPTTIATAIIIPKMAAPTTIVFIDAKGDFIFSVYTFFDAKYGGVLYYI